MRFLKKLCFIIVFYTALECAAGASISIIKNNVITLQTSIQGEKPNNKERKITIAKISMHVENVFICIASIFNAYYEPSSGYKPYFPQPYNP